MTISERISKRHRPHNKDRDGFEDVLARPDGTRIPVWCSQAADPIAHLAAIFDTLPDGSEDPLPE